MLVLRLRYDPGRSAKPAHNIQRFFLIRTFTQPYSCHFDGLFVRLPFLVILAHSLAPTTPITERGTASTRCSRSHVGQQVVWESNGVLRHTHGCLAQPHYLILKPESGRDESRIPMSGFIHPTSFPHQFSITITTHDSVIARLGRSPLLSSSHALEAIMLARYHVRTGGVCSFPSPQSYTRMIMGVYFFAVC